MNESTNIVCENCGGNDFCTEGGFYFCTECQTQSQEIQERVYDRIDNVQVFEKSHRIAKDPSLKSKHKLTSWEMYNYILLGLVNEMENIGAQQKFKEIVYQLWIQYLVKLEYISEDPNEKPKLSATYRKRDAEIIYQRRVKRRKLKTESVSNYSSSSVDSSRSRSLARKSRRAMEKSEYDKQSSTQNTDNHSTNQTLSGLSVEEEFIPGYIKYNRASKRELLKLMTRKHLERHIKDVKNEMTCHRISQKMLSKQYLWGPQILSRTKLYCLIYLGLRLTQQEFQISDLIRFCREGHLSFLEYKHFFPDTIDQQCIDSGVFMKGKNAIPTSFTIRKKSWDLFKFLELRPCDLSPDLLKLCKRFCSELNLPDQIYNITGDFIKKTRPLFPDKNKIIPNYEGRVMSFIIYTLKLLLNFDDITEFELTKFANYINQNIAKEKVFNFTDWYNYLEYRKIVLKNVHFPTWFLIEPNGDCPTDLFAKFTYKRSQIYEKDEADQLKMKILRDLMKKVMNLQEDDENLIDFKPSLTPFRSYLQELESIENFSVLGVKLNKEIIQDASKYTVKYLIEPKEYLEQLNNKFKVIYANAHPNHKLKRIYQIGEFFESTKEHWEKKWNRDFNVIKSDFLSLEQLADKVLQKHVHNVEQDKEASFNLSIDYILPPVDEKIKKVKNSVGRDNHGRFCKKSDPNCVDPAKVTPVKKKGKWHISSWNSTPIENRRIPSLVDQVYKNELIKSAQKSSNNDKPLNKNSKYKYHYIPRMEYCSNIRDVRRMSLDQWKEFEEKLPKNFQWLLKECARIVEQSTRDLYLEFVLVEVYMNYVHFRRQPVLSKPIRNYIAIRKLVKYVKSVW